MPVDRFEFGGLIFSLTYEFSKLQGLISGHAGLYRGQPRVLTILKVNQGCTLSELSELCGIGMPSLSVSVRNMEKAGLIRKESRGRDGRLQLLFLTDEGLRRALIFHEEIDGFYSHFLDSLGEEGAEAMDSCLRRFNEFLKETNSAMKSGDASESGDFQH